MFSVVSAIRIIGLANITAEESNTFNHVCFLFGLAPVLAENQKIRKCLFPQKSFFVSFIVQPPTVQWAELSTRKYMDNSEICKCHPTKTDCNRFPKNKSQFLKPHRRKLIFQSVTKFFKQIQSKTEKSFQQNARTSYWQTNNSPDKNINKDMAWQTKLTTQHLAKKCCDKSLDAINTTTVPKRTVTKIVFFVHPPRVGSWH